MTEKISDETTAQFIQAAIVSLRKDVVPALSDPSARIHADLITRVLYMLHGRFSRCAEDLQRLISETASLQQDIQVLLPGVNSGTPVAAEGKHFSAIEKLETELFETERRLVDKVPQLIALADESPSAAQLLRRVVEAQRQFLVAQDPDILKGSYVCYQGGKIEEERLIEKPENSGAGHADLSWALA